MEGLLAALAAMAVAFGAPEPPADDGHLAPGTADPPIEWRASIPLGLPYAGRPKDGVKLPPEGRDFFTWDPLLKQSPNRWQRRTG